MKKERMPLSLTSEKLPTRFLTWSPEPDSNRRPRPYQGRALPTELSGQTKTLAKKWKRVKKVAIAIWLVNSNLEENGSTSIFPRKLPFFTLR
jgi:hypothetical protein